MKRKTSRVILGMLLSILLGASLVGMQPGQAYSDCELDRFNAFMNANDQYTTTFHSWYFGQPVSCSIQCQNECNQLPEPQRTSCQANLSSCVTSCDSARFNTFTSAEDALISAANQYCSYNLDFCSQARGIRDQCVATYFGHMENPVLDGNGDIDLVWADMIITQYSSCIAASGVNYCE